MTEFREKRKSCQRNWNRLNTQKGARALNHQKIYKRAEDFNKISQINSEKECTDTAFDLHINQLKKIV